MRRFGDISRATAVSALRALARLVRRRLQGVSALPPGALRTKHGRYDGVVLEAMEPSPPMSALVGLGFALSATHSLAIHSRVNRVGEKTAAIRSCRRRWWSASARRALALSISALARTWMLLARSSSSRPLEHARAGRR